MLEATRVGEVQTLTAIPGVTDRGTSGSDQPLLTSTAEAVHLVLNSQPGPTEHGRGCPGLGLVASGRGLHAVTI